MAILTKVVDIDNFESDEVAEGSEKLVPNAEFITGSAGTGKTTNIKQRITEDRKWGILCATTGIAAVNLASEGDTQPITTINSLLKYFDTESLRENYATRKLHRIMYNVALRYRNIVIDEVSMMDARQLDHLYDATYEINKLKAIQARGGFGLVLTGDFCQLPPVKADYCFNAINWPNFAEHITRLTKIWRQSNPTFLEGLNAARRGDGEGCAIALQSIPAVTFRSNLDTHFEGTTVFSKNADVDRLNKVRIDDLIYAGNTLFSISSERWGIQRKEWSLIPDEITLCENAYIMILSNDTPQFTYANGSCGHIVDFDTELNCVTVKLVKNEADVTIKRITRQHTTKETPNGLEKPQIPTRAEYTSKATHLVAMIELTAESRRSRVSPSQPYFDFLEQRWVMGEITYLPVRAAYAATIHKTQGLTLDRVQVDMSNPFFGSPSMAYVALSRVREPEGLFIVGSPKMLAFRCNILADVLPWI